MWLIQIQVWTFRLLYNSWLGYIDKLTSNHIVLNIYKNNVFLFHAYVNKVCSSLNGSHGNRNRRRFMRFTIYLILRHNKVSNWQKTFTHRTLDAASMNDIIFHLKLLHLINFGTTYSTGVRLELDKWRMFFLRFLILRWCRVIRFLLWRENIPSCPEGW